MLGATESGDTLGRVDPRSWLYGRFTRPFFFPACFMAHNPNADSPVSMIAPPTKSPHKNANAAEVITLLLREHDLAAVAQELGQTLAELPQL